jgi:hypothetical protein
MPFGIVKISLDGTATQFPAHMLIANPGTLNSVLKAAQVELRRVPRIRLRPHIDECFYMRLENESDEGRQGAV